MLNRAEEATVAIKLAIEFMKCDKYSKAMIVLEEYLDEYSVDNESVKDGYEYAIKRHS